MIENFKEKEKEISEFNEIKQNELENYINALKDQFEK